MRIVIEAMTESDWPAVRDIYLDGIRSGNATFETDSPDWQTWDASHLEQPRLVALGERQVRGWAALSPVSKRRVYAGVAEVSVYVAEHARGKGIGLHLLEELVQQSEEHGLWTLQAGIFPENKSSIAIHEKCGFRIVGSREKIGKQNDRWRDVTLLERRSTVT